MPIAAVEARITQIESTLGNLSPQRTVAAGTAGLTGAPSLSGTAGTGGIIGSTGTVPGTGAGAGSAAGSTTGDSFSAALEDALGASTGSRASTASTGSAGSPAAAAGISAAAGAASASGASGASRATGSGSSGGSAFGDSVVQTAKKYLGIRYTWGGNSPSQGFDCSGLVKYVMRELGVSMPRVARDQAKVGTEIDSLAEARPGDLLGMRNGKHIAIYLGDNKILHAPQPGEKVSIRSLYSWDDIDTIRRVTPPAGAAPASSAGSTRAAFEQLAGASA